MSGIQPNMPFEAASSVIGLARWRARTAASAAKQQAKFHVLNDPVVRAVRTSVERHASKWARVQSVAHLGLAACAAIRSSSKAAPHTAAPGTVPYFLQMDAAMDTQSAWAARRRLRTHPLVLDKLRLWWDCALRSVQSGGSEHTGLDHDSYVRLSRLLHKAMIEEWDSDDADACAAEDWRLDSEGLAEIGEERFLNCIFELADVWTRTIEAAEYASFLQNLLDDIAVSGGDGSGVTTPLLSQRHLLRLVGRVSLQQFHNALIHPTAARVQVRSTSGRRRVRCDQRHERLTD